MIKKVVNDYNMGFITNFEMNEMIIDILAHGDESQKQIANTMCDIFGRMKCILPDIISFAIHGTELTEEIKNEYKEKENTLATIINALTL